MFHSRTTESDIRSGEDETLCRSEMFQRGESPHWNDLLYRTRTRHISELVASRYLARSDRMVQRHRGFRELCPTGSKSGNSGCPSDRNCLDLSLFCRQLSP